YPPSSRCVFDAMEGSQTVFYSFDPVHGRGPEVARLEMGQWPVWNLSADGSSLAVVDGRSSPPRIEVLSLVRRTRPQPIPDRKDLNGIAHIGPDVSGRGWMLTSYLDRTWNLLRVDETGRCIELLPPEFWMYSSAVSPDGHHVVFTNNTGEGTCGCWSTSRNL